jgi:hypothetical protein
MSQKEQSLTSTAPSQKIITPNKELVGLPKIEPKKEVTNQKDKLPQPTGWRILVLPFKMNEKTKGGVIMNESTLERQQVASQCGNVLAMGSECYKDIQLAHGARLVTGWSSRVTRDHVLILKVGKSGC